jgi:hypothetical protein
MTTLRELIAAGATRAELERAATEAGHGDIVAAHARGTKGELLASLVVALEPPPDTSIPAPGDTSNPGDAAGDTSNPGDAAGDTSNPGDAAGDTSNPGDAAGDTSNAGGEVSRGPRVLTRSEALAPIARELEQLQTAEPPADPVQAARLAMARELAATQLRMMRAAPIGLLTAFVRDTQNDPTAEVIEDPAPPHGGRRRRAAAPHHGRGGSRVARGAVGERFTGTPKARARSCPASPPARAAHARARARARVERHARARAAPGRRVRHADDRGPRPRRRERSPRPSARPRSRPPKWRCRASRRSCRARRRSSGACSLSRCRTSGRAPRARPPGAVLAR